MKKSSRTQLVLFVTLLTATAAAQTRLYGQGDDNLETLRAKPNRQEAYALYKDGLLGSSADLPRAGTVAEKCQSALNGKLTPSQREVLQSKLDLCTLEYEGIEGTMWRSAENTCAVGIYVDFVGDLAKASQPIPHASFDCTHAQTPLEQTVCTDPQLGHYDLLMTNAYKSRLTEMNGTDKIKLFQNQRAWNAATPVACSLKTVQPTSATLSCLHAHYRDRMQNLIACGAGKFLICLDLQPPINEGTTPSSPQRVHTIN